MSYPSVDKLQNLLAEKVFGYAKDRKKASGRALGTLVEIVTFYTACAWDLRDSIAIEKAVPEFANPGITHNVEFSLHPILSKQQVVVQPLSLPLTSAKIFLAADLNRGGYVLRNEVLLSKDRVMRNSAIIATKDNSFTTAHLLKVSKNDCAITLADLGTKPYAIFECKRVGVEEGMRKGPQTIEKAKQGAYVARSISSLQKFRSFDGKVRGVFDGGKDQWLIDEYATLLQRVVESDKPAWLRDFILTVGVVSNHGNWFTSDNQNKELRVLAQSYDWLLFLTDNGLCQFIEKLLLHPVRELEPAREAFLSSYRAQSSGNCFTKVKVRMDADIALKRYFEDHKDEIESWFNVIAPSKATLAELKEALVKLDAKDWGRIHKV